MNRRAFQFFTWLAWLALPLIALRYWQSWDQLPLRMATHFDINGHANGWMSRDVSMWFVLGITAFLLAVFTSILLVMHSQTRSGAASWVTLVFCYLVIGFVFYGNNLLIDYNLHGSSPTLSLKLMVVPLAVLALVAVFLRSHRGAPLAAAPWLAQETHASPLFAVILLLPALVQLWILSAAPHGIARVTLALMCLLFLVIAIFAGTGFRYYFGPAGVEIRALGYRLRSIPASQIASYAIEPWNILRGYGIRGVGGTRAYVWSNKVVHIKTSQGEVFLGHSQPERIIRDLDMITQNRRQEVSPGVNPL